MAKLPAFIQKGKESFEKIRQRTIFNDENIAKEKGKSTGKFFGFFTPTEKSQGVYMTAKELKVKCDILIDVNNNEVTRFMFFRRKMKLGRLFQIKTSSGIFYRLVYSNTRDEAEDLLKKNGYDESTCEIALVTMII